MSVVRSQANVLALKKSVSNNEKTYSMPSIREVQCLVVEITQFQIPHILRCFVFPRSHQVRAYLLRLNMKT